MLGHGLALLSGAIAAMAFSPFDYYPLAIFSLVLLFLTWDEVSASVAAWRGLLFGIGLFGVGISWVYIAIYVFGQAGSVIATGLTALLVILLASYLAIIAYLIKRLSPQRQFRWAEYILLLPVAWLFFEWCKGWLFSGFPWLELGTSQVNGPLSGYIPVIGALGVSGLVALSAGLLAYGWRYRYPLAVIPVLLIWLGGVLLQSMTWTLPDGEPIKVSLIQGNVPQSIKWDKAQLLDTMALYQAETGRHWDSDVIIWPENAMTAFYHQIKPDFLDPLADKAKENQTIILAGMPFYDMKTARYYNSLVSLGGEFEVYHKHRLVPFGDYMPFEWLRGLLQFFNLPMSDFSPGPEKQPLFSAAGQKLGISICYEDIFSAQIRALLPAATMLVNVTNNAWYGDSFAPHQHLQIAQSRALETGRPILRATTNGISAFINHRGELTAVTTQFERQVLSATVQGRIGATPYVYWQYWPMIIIVSLLWLLWLWTRLRPEAG